jgi:hypothetical protein
MAAACAAESFRPAAEPDLRYTTSGFIEGALGQEGSNMSTYVHCPWSMNTLYLRLRCYNRLDAETGAGA